MTMRKHLTFLLLGMLAALSSPAAAAFDSRAYVERAVVLIEAGHHELARAYLEPALIDPRLDRGERSRAYYLRGYSLYAQGHYVSAVKDYNHALEFYPGNPVVQTAVAQMHLEGLGVPANPRLAVVLFEQAAEAGHEPAKLRLGIAYLRGTGLPRDLDAARHWLGEAAEAGSSAAMLYLAQSHRAAFADDADPALARRWLERAAAAGEADAIAYLGFMAEAGEGMDVDLTGARNYFERAAQAGSALAQAKLAHLYLAGNGGEADAERALALFRQAAERGHPSGFMGLAYLYDSGTGVTQDREHALLWYERAAAAGSVDAQIRLAYEGLRQSGLEGQQQARDWFAKAAAQNHPQALNDYAWLLATSPYDTIRNGQQALTLALQAVARQRSPAYLDTLAAAYAETGKFQQAVETQREAIALVPDDRPDLAAELRDHLDAFEADKPWRE
jgi:TPR repeat protein